MSQAKIAKSEIVENAEKSQKEEVISSMKSQMRASITSATGSIGPNGSLRQSILTAVVEERYDSAITRLQEYIDSKPEFPDFRERCIRYSEYGVELIHAIRTKRSFPGWNALNMSKQKELFERALHHFEDLKATLTKIEVVEKEVRMEDVRTTVWVVKAAVYAVSALLLFVFLREMTGGVLPIANNVIESSTSSIVDLAFDKLNL
jgi:AcrR family transcriptional regulator